MSRRERDKGKVGEREVAELLRERWGVEARRGRQYAGHPEAPDVVSGLPGVHVEGKRRERGCVETWLREAEAQAGERCRSSFSSAAESRGVSRDEAKGTTGALC